MALVAVNLSDRLILPIKELVEKGLYQSFEAFLEIAAFNQLALERGASPAEVVERGHRKIRHEAGHHDDNGVVPARVKAAKHEPERTTRTATQRRQARPVARVVVDEETVTEADYEAAFKRLALTAWTDNSPKPCQPARDDLSKERVFGQVNRLLPLKLACRWLASSAAAEGKWSKYDLISDRLADDAATVGSLLEKWDNDNGRKRDELLATGLPRRGNSASRDRFLSQFLARITRSGEVYPGAICQYQLARFAESMIVLTEQGLAFSRLENPVLDQRDPRSSTTLAPAESEFLARQILEWVPAEREDMQVVLQAVAAGKATPPELAEAVRPRFPAEWSDSVFQTHASGIVARLGELRLLKRSWQGRHVTYQLGDRQQVESFLSAQGPGEHPTP